MKWSDLFSSSCRPAMICAALAMLAFPPDSFGQGKGKEDNPGQSQGKGKPTITDRPVVEPRNSGDSDSKGKPESPGRPDKTDSTPEVKNLVTRFQAAREAWLQQQKELRVQLKDATEEQREAIRQQIQESLERWKEQHREFVEDVKTRAHSLKDELDTDLGRVIDRGTDEGRGR